MAKFAGSPPRVTGPVSTVDVGARTFNGARALSRDAKSDLFLLAVTNMVGEDTFYESATSRDSRFRDLVHQVAVEDFDWLARFVPYLRNEMFMRSASIVVAAEAVWARLNIPAPSNLFPTATNRQVIASAIKRADEPAEMLAYWGSRYGKNYPKPVKRGVGDALVRVLNEYSALKYDGVASAWRLGDLLNLTHPSTDAPWQKDLFAYLLDRRHHNDVRVDLANLPVIRARRALETVPLAQRRAMLRDGSTLLQDAKVTWEYVSGWIPGGMDREAWEAAIPTMGHMALIRNLRNFDQAGVSDEVAEKVAARISDPNEVARGMQFPFRYYSAYKAAAGSLRWGHALSKALDLSCSNIPAFEGKTLSAIDTSGSMSGTMSGKSTLMRMEAGAVLAAAVAKRQGVADLVQWADWAAPVKISAGDSVLTIVARVVQSSGSVGHGTSIRSVQPYVKDHKRVLVFSDFQTHDEPFWPNDLRVYGFNLAGYGSTVIDTSKNQIELGGLNDKTFSLISMIERGRNADWPF